MKISSIPSPLSLNILLIALLLAGIVFAFATGRRLPLIGSARGTMIAVLVLGFAMCTIGGSGRIAATGEWTHPLSILGILLGVAIFVIGLGTVFGLKLPFIRTEAQAVMIAAALVLVKIANAVLHSLINRGN